MSATHPELALRLTPEAVAAVTAEYPGAHDLSAIAGQEATSELPGDIVVIDNGCDSATALLETYALRRPDAAMVVIGDDLPSQAVRALFRFSASDVLPSSTNREELLDTISQLSEELAQRRRESGPASTCWVFRGAVGGSGVTTLAIEAAFALARRDADRSVCLIDLNLPWGMAASYLDGQAKLDLQAVCAAPERIDANLMRVYTWRHEKGISLIAPPRHPDADSIASEAGVLQLLDVACSMFDRVIVDLPRHKLAWTGPIQSAADEVFVISELTVPSLHAAADLCREVDMVRDHGRPARLVLNRMFAKRSHRHGFPLEKAERAIHRNIDFTIRSDWDSARMAVNLGMPVAQVKEKSPLVKDVAEMVEAAASGVATQAMTASAGGR